MPAQILQAVLTVDTLAPDAEVEITHTLRSGNLALVPTIILPDTASSIGVVAADDTTITFRNYGDAPAEAVFLAQYDHSIQAAYSGPPIALWWRGFVGGGGGGVSASPTETIVIDSPDADLPVLYGRVSFNQGDETTTCLITGNPEFFGLTTVVWDNASTKRWELDMDPPPVGFVDHVFWSAETYDPLAQIPEVVPYYETGGTTFWSFSAFDAQTGEHVYDFSYSFAIWRLPVNDTFSVVDSPYTPG